MEASVISTQDFIDATDLKVNRADRVMVILESLDFEKPHSVKLLKVQKLVSAARKLQAVRVLFIDCNGAGLRADPGINLLESFVIVLRQEYPALDIRLLQMDVFDKDCAVNALQMLFTDHVPYPVLKYSSNTLLAPTFHPAQLSIAANSRLLEHGKYLITGANGAIGRLLARHLAIACNATLYLAARQEIDNEQIKTLEHLGASVQTLCFDVTDAREVDAATADISEFDGIFHLAGVSGESALLSVDELDESRVESILEPKIEGAKNLLHIAAAKGSRFFVGFSSLSTVLGGLGFSAYAAANAAMDALLSERNAKGVKCFSLGWDGFNLDNNTASGLLDPDDAFQIMQQVIDSGLSGRFLITATPLHSRIRQWVTLENDFPDSGMDKALIETREAVKQELEFIWRKLLGAETIRANDSFAFLGGDSMLAVQMLTMINKIFPSTIGMREIMDASTFVDLVNLLWDKRASQNQPREIGEI